VHNEQPRKPINPRNDNRKSISPKAKQSANMFNPVLNPLLSFFEKFECGADYDITKMDIPGEEPSGSEKEQHDDWETFRRGELSTADQANPDDKDWNSVKRDTSPRSNENWEYLESMDGVSEEPISLREKAPVSKIIISTAPVSEKRRKSPVSESRSKGAPKHPDIQGSRVTVATASSSDSGAFSAAFEKGKLSSIPNKKLSLSPQSRLETSQDLFFKQQITTSDAYQMSYNGEKVVEKFFSQASPEKVRGPSERSVLTKDDAERGQPSEVSKPKGGFKNRFSRAKRTATPTPAFSRK